MEKEKEDNPFLLKSILSARCGSKNTIFYKIFLKKKKIFIL